jgi:hypothetical protein
MKFLYPKIQGVTNLAPLTESRPEIQEEASKKKQDWFIGCSQLFRFNFDSTSLTCELVALTFGCSQPINLLCHWNIVFRFFFLMSSWTILKDPRTCGLGPVMLPM